mgnify:CR=1 FL=1
MYDRNDSDPEWRKKALIKALDKNDNYYILEFNKVGGLVTPYPLQIIYEDEEIVVINKAPGMVVHPGHGNYSGTLVNGLLHHFEKLPLNSDNKPGLVHRIDKDTSGLLVVAKTANSMVNLSKQFHNKTASRKYVALVWGVIRPLNGKISTLISRSKKNRQLMSVSDRLGKKAVTNYKTIKTFSSKEIPKISLVECILETGRTHQIRVHMSYKGNNILGDKTYKKKFKSIKKVNDELVFLINNLNRQFLHSGLIGLTHPMSGKYLEFKANLPNELNIILKKLRKTQK